MQPHGYQLVSANDHLCGRIFKEVVNCATVQSCLAKLSDHLDRRPSVAGCMQGKVQHPRGCKLSPPPESEEREHSPQN
jgi:hypothetical protein